MTLRKKDYNTSSFAIAWDIACEIMTRNADPLSLTVLHPGGEQYECITVMKNANDVSQDLLINLHGESILANGELLRPYQELYKKDKQLLLSDISSFCGYRLATKAIRELYAMGFVKRLAEVHHDAGQLLMTSAWYDGSDSSRLNSAAKDFPYYEHRNSMDRQLHLPWWIISYSQRILAMCNFATNELILLNGNHYYLNKHRERERAWMEIENEIRFSEVSDTVSEALRLVRANDEWIGRYREYARTITNNLDDIKQARKAFREWSPLKFYLNVTNAKKASSRLVLGVRYQGQEVAELILNKAKSETPALNTAANDYDKKNAGYFGWHKSLNMVDWRGTEAKAFRTFFKNNPPRIGSSAKRNEEHRIESLLLSEFSKNKSAEKALPNIQPVKIGGIRFPMPTPISASNHKKIKYSNIYGGGIDILTRVGKSGRSAKLCVIELKDENDPKESAIEVIKQASAYAAFIRELLRSESGGDWWKLFGFSKPLPKKLTLYAACAMPSGEGNDYSFADKEIRIEEDVIRFHYIYFREADHSISSVESSLNNRSET